MIKNTLQNRYILVKVESGIPAFVEVFEEKKKAKLREKYLRKEMHPENDETAIFELQI